MTALTIIGLSFIALAFVVFASASVAVGMGREDV